MKRTLTNAQRDAIIAKLAAIDAKLAYIRESSVPVDPVEAAKLHLKRDTLERKLYA